MTSTLPRHATKPLPMPGFEETFYKGTESFNRFPALKDQLKSSPTQNQSTLPVLLTPSKQQPDRRYFVARLSHAATIEVDVLPFDDGFSDVSVERSMTSSGKDFLEALRKIVTSFALASVKAQVVGDQTRPLFLNAASQEGLISVLSGRWVVQELKASEAISSMFCKATASTATAKDEEKWFAKLDSFASLKPGWDSYRAEPPLAATIRAAKEFLKFLQKKGTSPTNLKPSVVGGVGFSFRNGPRTVYIEFRNTGNTHAAFTDGASEPEVVKVPQDATGYAEVVTRAVKYLHEQTARCHENQRSPA